MAVVGLSFGSPSSGTGFDVTSTIETLVTNLRKIEKPWSTEMTSLQSQDTAISNLGTLLSTLSSDLSKLTSYSGVLLQKTGSSSNNSILQLTAATTSATAGTHTIVVKNLATSGAGHLATITNADDTLTGSMTIQVGSGTAQTISLGSSGGTLSDLAKAINKAGVGATANVVTDANGVRLTLVSNTSGRNGAIAVTGNSIVDTSNASTALAYNNAVTPVDANLTIDGLDLSSATNTVSNLIPGITFQLLSPSGKNSDNSYAEIQVVIANDNTSVESAMAVFVTDYNSLVSAMNAQESIDSSGHTAPLYGSPTLSLLQQQLFSAVNASNPNGYLDLSTAISGTTLSGSIDIQVGSGQTNTVTLDASTNTVSGLADAINQANIGVSANVVTSGTTSTIALYSKSYATNSGLTVTSNLTQSSPTALAATTTDYASGQNSSSTLATVAAAGDVLSGSISIQVGSKTAQTIAVDASSNTLSTLADAINQARAGVTATVATDNDGKQTLTLSSQTNGTSGNLTISSSLYDTTARTTSAVTYNSSSNIRSLITLGMAMSASSDGSLEFDAATLDSVLNSNFSGVEGFFQYVDSWGKSFASMLTNLGTGSTKGMLSLAAGANSSAEETLKDLISREEHWISTEQARLTTQLNAANQILQSLPSQLDSINMLYSAITGYNTK